MKIRDFSENLEAKRRKLKAELLKGKENVLQLQALLLKPAAAERPSLLHDLVLQTLTSFSKSLTELSNNWSELTELTPNAAADGGSSVSADKRQEKKTAAGQDGRVCHKRRRSSDSLVTLSPSHGDGYAWRKYGQKHIIGAKYPRCYFRCTHKSQGCKALKQVQRSEESPQLYQTTYFNLHTCKDTLVLPPHSTVVSDPKVSNLLGFQAKIPIKEECSPNPTNISSVSEDFSDANSSLDLWHDVMGQESLIPEAVWTSPYGQEDSAFGFPLSSSSGLHGLDVEADKFGDISNLQFDES